VRRDDYPTTLTAKHVKEILNVGIHQAYDIIRRPDFPKFYVGRAIKIPRDAFFRWYDEVTGKRLDLSSSADLDQNSDFAVVSR
jgi:hypothetical protein